MMRADFVRRGQNMAAFVFFSACLVLPSGYSWGAALSALVALLGLAVWRRGPFAPSALLLGALWLLAGLMWSHGFDDAAVLDLAAWNSGDKFFKYLLAVVALLCMAVVGMQSRRVWQGLACGAALTLPLALWQFHTLGRATGFTNAIQFGDMAVALGLMCWCGCAVPALGWRLRGALLAAGAAWVGVSLLSLSRGGWLLLLVAPCLGLLLAAGRPWQAQAGPGRSGGGWRAAGAAAAALVLACGALGWGAYQVDAVGNRARAAIQEVRGYLASPDTQAETSVGQRLEQWRLAWRMVQDRPWTGWGQHGLEQGKRDYVAQGLAHPSVLAYGHAHNEVLDMWVRRGAAGLLILGLLYVVPVLVFWPTAVRCRRVPQALRTQWLALRVAALVVPVGCVVFGMTQVFFAHNSGHFFYVFTQVFLYGAVQSLEGGNTVVKNGV